MVYLSKLIYFEFLNFLAYYRCYDLKCWLGGIHLVSVFFLKQFWQVWNLESRSLVCSLQWESNITAFSVISGSHFMYVGELLIYSKCAFVGSSS